MQVGIQSPVSSQFYTGRQDYHTLPHSHSPHAQHRHHSPHHHQHQQHQQHSQPSPQQHYQPQQQQKQVAYHSPYSTMPLGDKRLSLSSLTAPSPSMTTANFSSGAVMIGMPLECSPERIALWLEELGIIQPDPADVHSSCASSQAINSANGMPQQNVIDMLFGQLKDGVALVHLMNRIQPGSITSINLHTERPFAALDNINKFLAACASLGISEKESFEVNDLYFGQDFQKVLRTLAVLGRKVDLLQKLGRIPYCPSLFSPPCTHRAHAQGSPSLMYTNHPSQHSLQQHQHQQHQHQQQQHQLVSSTIAQSQLNTPLTASALAAALPSHTVPTNASEGKGFVTVQNTYAVALYTYTAQMNDEVSFYEGDIVKIYRRMDGGWWEGEAREKRGWLPSNYVQVLEGARPSPSRAAVHLMEDEEEKKRAHETLIRQMLNAEEAYVASIENFVMTCVEPLRNKEWFPEEDFRPIETCMQIAWHAQNSLEEFLQSEAAQHGVATMSVGHCFMKLGDLLMRSYMNFADNRACAEDVIKRYQDNPNMNTFLKSLKWHREPSIVHISAFILKPLQRLQSYYPLLLQELYKVTPSSHIDHVHLPKAIDMLNIINEHVSAHRATLENRQLLRDVADRIEGWEGPPLNEFGDLVMDGVLRLYKGDQCRDIFCFFLEKLVVVLQRSMKGWQDGATDGKYKLVEVVPLVQESVSILDVKDCAEIRNAFILDLRNLEGKSKEVILSAYTAATKQAWLQKLIEQVGKNTGVRQTEPTATIHQPGSANATPSVSSTSVSSTTTTAPPITTVPPVHISHPHLVPNPHLTSAPPTASPNASSAPSGTSSTTPTTTISTPTVRGSVTGALLRKLIPSQFLDRKQTKQNKANESPSSLSSSLPQPSQQQQQQQPQPQQQSSQFTYPPSPALSPTQLTSSSSPSALDNNTATTTHSLPTLTSSKQQQQQQQQQQPQQSSSSPYSAASMSGGSQSPAGDASTLGQSNNGQSQNGGSTLHSSSPLSPHQQLQQQKQQPSPLHVSSAPLRSTSSAVITPTLPSNLPSLGKPARSGSLTVTIPPPRSLIKQALLNNDQRNGKTPAQLQHDTTPTLTTPVSDETPTSSTTSSSQLTMTNDHFAEMMHAFQHLNHNIEQMADRLGRLEDHVYGAVQR